jgi:hypothetical protein
MMAPSDLSLSELEARIWAELRRAAGDRDHGWRQPCLATRDGDDVRARTVILREVDIAARQLMFFSDARSAKVAQIAAHPRGTLMCWSALLGWQLRLSVTLSVQADGLAVSSRWARLKLKPAAQDYMSPLPPGSALDAATATTPAPIVRESRHHFAVLTAAVGDIDWLALHPDGHLRAGFGADGAVWLQP